MGYLRKGNMARNSNFSGETKSNFVNRTWVSENLMFMSIIQIYNL